MKLFTIHYSYLVHSRTIISLFTIILALAMMMSSCKPDAKAVSGKSVKITVEQQTISSGFLKVRFSTNKEAYYHVGVLPTDEMPDLSKSANVKSFMALMLDQAYADYLYWRGDLLRAGTANVAAFASHSLQYGTVEYNFTLLKPDTRYTIFAFPVDTKTNKPDGKLFTVNTATASTSAYEDMQFVYRIRGYWDYVYPTSPRGDVLADAPWGGLCVDSLNLVGEGYGSPKEFFSELFEAFQLYQANDYIHFGIYVHNNDYFSADIPFLEGHIYYTGLMLMDGYLSRNASVIYKFRWQGEDTSLRLTREQALTTDW